MKKTLVGSALLAGLLALAGCDRKEPATSTTVTPDTSQTAPAGTSPSTTTPVAPDSPASAGGTGAPMGGSLPPTPQPDAPAGATGSGAMGGSTDSTGTTGGLGTPGGTGSMPTPSSPNATTGQPLPPPAEAPGTAAPAQSAR